METAVPQGRAMAVRSDPRARVRPSGAHQRTIPPRKGLRTGLRWMLRPANLSLILVIFWLTSPIAPLVPNLDDALSHVYAVQTDRIIVSENRLNEEFLRLMWLPCYAIILALALRHLTAILMFLLRHWIVSVLLAWTFLSYFWSINPEDTLRRFIALAICSIGGIMLGLRYDNLQVARLLAVALLLGVAASYVSALAFPATGISGGGSYIGSWRGAYVNKNSLGGAMLKACFVFWLLYYVDKNRWWLVALALAGALLALSTSKTPLVVLLILVAILTVAHVSMRSPRHAPSVGALGIIVLIALLMGSIIFRDPLLVILDRDPTFTGRAEVWSLTWEAIQHRLWLGYGYAAFWSEHYGPATAIWDSLNWRVPNSHSGVLEIWLGLGVVGVVLFALFVFHACLLIVRRARRVSLPELLWCIGTMLMFLVYSTTESASLEHNSLGWVLVLSVVAALARGDEAKTTQRVLPPMRRPPLRPAPARLRRRPAT